MNRVTLRRVINDALERARKQGIGKPLLPCSGCGTAVRLRIPIADDKQARIRDRLCVDCAQKLLEGLAR